MKFRCDCRGQILEVVYDKPTKKFPFPSLSVLIYDVYSPKTGKKYKKPKLLGDVVLMNNAYPHELTKFLGFMQDKPQKFIMQVK